MEGGSVRVFARSEAYRAGWERVFGKDAGWCGCVGSEGGCLECRCCDERDRFDVGETERVYVGGC